MIPKSVRTIGERAFGGCTGLKTIKYDGTKEEWEEIGKKTKWNENMKDFEVRCRNA